MKPALSRVRFRSLDSASRFHRRGLVWTFVLMTGLFSAGCGALGLGKFKGIERTSGDEAYYLLKEIHLSAASAGTPKEIFDHKQNDTVNLFFVPNNEKPVYVAESIWYDPNDQEFRTIRVTYDRAQESKKAIDRPKEGSTRVHSISTQELYNHKPGFWKVALYIDKQLARRQTFFVR